MCGNNLAAKFLQLKRVKNIPAIWKLYYGTTLLGGRLCNLYGETYVGKKSVCVLCILK